MLLGGTKIEMFNKVSSKNSNRKVNLSNTTNSKKREFRIKRQKSLKERLFTAYPREEEEAYNAVAQEFKGKVLSFNRNKAISPLLPPIIGNTKNKSNSNPLAAKGNPQVNISNIQGSSTNKKSKPSSK